MADYTVYGYRESGSAAIEVALVAANIPFTFHDLDAENGALETVEFRTINPRGQVPAVMHPDGSIITEVPAILNHFADAFPESGLAPAPGSSARAQHDRWLAFLHANVYEAVLRYFYTDRYTDDSASVPAVQSAAKSYISRHLALFGDAIAKGPFLFGDQPYNVDYLAWTLTTWLDPELVQSSSPAVARLAQALATHPGLEEVVALNTE
ncbi:glutathione S-transferase family protein [Roseovarius sp. 2305UL8-3]|uniref:glutathione S-transferase family protein n=1 Tax=Roseovarius conchicola TaxID=3121636 RepID=UPI003527B150